MVEIIEKSVCRGIAGRLRSTKGVMIHNTADSHSAKSHTSRLAGYTNKQLENGFANYFIDKDTIYRTEDTYNATYHSANGEGNYNYISFEVVGDMKTSKADFLQAEQNTFYQAAIDLRYHKLPVNHSTVRLHCELDVGTYTECPKRSLYEHTGYNSNQRQPQNVINEMKDYFIKEIKKYYDNPKLKPDGGGTNVTKAEVLDAKKFPTMVKMVRDNKVYNNANFGDKSLSRAVFKKGTVIYAIGIEYSASGKPRIKTNSGYILATDNYVGFL